MKTIFTITGGCQSIQRNINNKSYASIKLNQSKKPVGFADIATSSTQCWFSKDKELDFVNDLNKLYKTDRVTFNIIKFDKYLLLDINPF